MAITYLSGGRIQGILGTAVAAITGWDNADGSGAFTLTSGTGIIVNASSSHSNTAAVYDLGTSGQLTPDDDWVCDYTVTRNSSDVFDHPMLMFKSQNTGYGTGVPNNGDNQILFQYWANGATNDQSGSNVMNTRFRAGGTEYETGAQVSVGSNVANIPAIGTTLYYRITMNARAHTMSAWTTSDDRTAGSTDSTRVVHATSSSAGGALNSGWDQSDPLRYVMVIHRNNNNGRWTISDFKFWNATTSTSGTPDVAFTFTDVPTADEKATITNVPAGTRYEETDTRKIYRREIGALDNTTGLVMHYKLNESSGDIINYGTAGTNQNLAVTGLTRDVATPSGLDNGMSSVQNGSDYAQGTTPQRGAWDFFQQDDSGDYTGTWSICFWFKASALPRQDYTPTETHLIGNIWTDDDGAGFEIRFRGSSNDATPTACKLQLLISNGTTMPINSASSGDMIPDITDPHFYCLTYDANASSNNLTMSRDAATSGSGFHQGTDTSNAYSTGSPTRRITFFAKDDGAHGVGGTLAQVLVFKDRILTQAEKVALYASGNGISSLSSSWKEKGTA